MYGWLNSKVFFFLFGICWLLNIPAFAQTAYAPDELIVKFNSDFAIEDCNKSWRSAFGVKRVESIFPTKPHEVSSDLDLEINRIYSFFIEREKSILKAKQNLERTGLFEYVELRYYGQLAYTPNDPGFANQYALSKIEAPKAWDLSKGNAAVLIGVVDAGIDTGHSDLKGKFYEHTADPINGRDDDNDGYIDNYWGWDFKTKTGNVQFSAGVDHGVQMAGCIAPSTDNGFGIAGAAFNCKMLAIKVTNGSSVVYGYEGIKYAADKGCKVINCSWNIKAYSKFGEEMVNYATAKGALVVAATGNQGKEDVNYPAMYKNVLAVTNTDLNDNRVTNSNIGYYADVSAPGLNVVSTKANTGFERNSGTSYSSAITSGVAGLLASYKPSLSPQELFYTLKKGSDPLYENGKNSFYKNKLGTGRVNAFKALSNSGSWLELDSLYFTDVDGGAIEQSDSVIISTWLSNYLNVSNNVVVVLKDRSNYATVVDSIWTISTLSKNSRTSNSATPFKIRLASSIPQNEELEFEVEIRSQTDTTTTGFSIIVNPTYRDIKVNKLHTTIGSRGTFGFYEYPQKKGIGVTYDGGAQMLYEGGLVIGVGTEKSSTVVDRVRGVRDVEQTDFRTVEGLQEITPPTSDLGFNSTFDDGASKSPIGIEVKQHTRAWNAAAHDDYVIIDYVISSKTNKKLQNLYVGLFADWDIANSEENMAKYDGQRYTAYTYSEENGAPYAGIQLLSEYDDWRCYSIDHIIGGAGGIDITDNDVFSKQEKFKALSNYRENAGKDGAGADVLQMLSTGPHTINEGDSLKVSFAIHGANSLVELLENADSAFFRENGKLPMSIGSEVAPTVTLYPNPSNGKVTLMGNALNLNKISIHSILGNSVPFSQAEVSGGVLLELGNIEPGLYLISVDEMVYRWQVIK